MSVISIQLPEYEPRDTGVLLWQWTPDAFQRAATLGWFDNARVELRDGSVFSQTAVYPTANQKRQPDTLWRFTRENYEAAGATGVFAPGERLELLYGRVFRKLPQSPQHTQGIRATSDTLTAAFGPGFDVRQQQPLVLLQDGEPEPDVAVVPGTWQDYSEHPTQSDVLLLVEISDTTLRYDRTEKAALYAQAGIADYWIANLQNRTLEVHRDPAPVPTARHGFDYQTRMVYAEADSLSPLALPDVVLRVADLLPPVKPAIR